MTTDAEPGPIAEPTARVFISYSRRDMVFAGRLEAALKARGFETLIDRAEIYAFEDWWKRIQVLIGQADTIVFVLSPDAVTSDVALKEVGHAETLNKRFAPIVCRPVDAQAVPEAVRRLNFIFFDDDAHFEASADQLARALQTDIGWIRQHTEYGEAARRWSAAGRPSGLLLRSPALDLAEHWLTSRPRDAPSPSEETRSFIADSRTGALAAQRLRRAVQIVIYTLLLGIIAGLVGWINQAYIKEQWTWYTVVRPYIVAKVQPYVLTVKAEQALKPQDTFRECVSDCPEMIVIPPGTFMMGSPVTEPGRFNTEGPLHSVTIAQRFAVSRFDVTFDDWDACVSVGGCPDTPDGGYGRGTRPAINVGWGDAQTYAAWLSKMTGQTYRLLTEAEWEYAARAGTTTAYYWGNEIGKGNANCSGCGSKWDSRETSPVGSFKPNAFGLYDMAGNVLQWVQDCWRNTYDEAPVDGSARSSGDCSRPVVRGGTWSYDPRFARSANRNWYSSVNRSLYLGFRVARTLVAP